nr:MAG TPA: hypothetical protein [Bacteriophage sp.]
MYVIFQKGTCYSVTRPEVRLLSFTCYSFMTDVKYYQKGGFLC